MNLRARAAELERKYKALPPARQAAVVETAAVIFSALSPRPDGCPEDMMLGIFDLLQNAGGKVSRGLMGQAQVIAEIQAGAPTVSAAFLAKLGV